MIKYPAILATLSMAIGFTGLVLTAPSWVAWLVLLLVGMSLLNNVDKEISDE